MKLILTCLLVLYGIVAEADKAADKRCANIPKPGICWKAWHSKYYYHALARTCVHWEWTGCGGNWNNFDSVEECENYCGHFERKQLCELEPDRGTCGHGNFATRYYFNSKTKTCETFAYEGCGGNQNNFPTKLTCYQACKCEYTFPLNGKEEFVRFISWKSIVN